MTPYLLAFVTVLLCNVVPAFAPPTWAVLVFFTLQYQLSTPTLVVLGVVGASLGRWILAHGFRRYRNVLPHWYLTNMENAGAQVTKSMAHTTALLGLFFISPLSSAQLFEAAGIMTKVPLRPLILAFAAGRTITYSIYVGGATALSDSSLGEVIARNLTTPKGIALQVAMVLALVGLGAIKWRPVAD
jgi:hypothetical protein